eukprot:3124856-Ditylum_brightwellii.AAC.1
MALPSTRKIFCMQKMRQYIFYRCVPASPLGPHLPAPPEEYLFEERGFGIEIFDFVILTRVGNAYN